MPLPTESLSIQQARKLVLLSQKVLPEKQAGSAIDATLSIIEHLGYIQIDTISVIQRAHHHTLWNRNPRYTISYLDKLVTEQKVFEYWSHAAAYLPMNDFRYSLPRKRAIKEGTQDHWWQRDEKLMAYVLKRIADEGPLMAKDFEHTDKTGDWQTKPAKQALEYLFMQGELMIASRQNFHKVYDLTERVLPDGIDTTMPSEEEYARFLITQYLTANGLGLASEIVYLLKNTKPLVAHTLKEMYSSSELLQVKVGNEVYYALPNALKLLSKPLSRKKLKILSPFDNFLIQRKRMHALFNFDYQIECYVPAPKRTFGYFSLPIVWDGKLVARMDCKADRKESVLHILHIALEDHLGKTEAFSLALWKELRAFMKFNDCKSFMLHKSTPASFMEVFKNSIKNEE